MTAAARGRTTRWSASDAASALTASVVAVSLFLPWYGVAIGFIGTTATGLKVNAYLWVAFALCLAELGYLLLAACAPDTAARVPVHRDALLAELNLLTLVIVMVAFFAKRGTGTDWRYGAVVAVAGASLGAIVKMAVVLSPGGRSVEA